MNAKIDAKVTEISKGDKENQEPKSNLKKKVKKRVTFGVEETKEFYNDEDPNMLEKGIFTQDIKETPDSGSKISQEITEQDRKKLKEFMDHLTGIATPKQSSSFGSIAGEIAEELRKDATSFSKDIFGLITGEMSPLEYANNALKERLHGLKTDVEKRGEPKKPVNREKEYVDFFKMLDEKGIGFSDLAKNSLTQKGAGTRLHLSMNLLNRENIDEQGMAEIALAVEKLGLNVTKRISDGKPDGFEFNMNPQSALDAYIKLKEESQSPEQIKRCEKEIEKIEKEIEFQQKFRPTPRKDKSGLTLADDVKLPKDEQKEMLKNALDKLHGCSVGEIGTDTGPKKPANFLPKSSNQIKIG